MVHERTDVIVGWKGLLTLAPADHCREYGLFIDNTQTSISEERLHALLRQRTELPRSTDGLEIDHALVPCTRLESGHVVASPKKPRTDAARCRHAIIDRLHGRVAQRGNLHALTGFEDRHKLFMARQRTLSEIHKLDSGLAAGRFDVL